LNDDDACSYIIQTILALNLAVKAVTYHALNIINAVAQMFVIKVRERAPIPALFVNSDSAGVNPMSSQIEERVLATDVTEDRSMSAIQFISFF
jgi:hypothetical protein